MGSILSIWDIDGVLADVRHRVHWVERKPKRWVEFFEAAPDDGVLAEGAARLRVAVESGCEITYLTGRPEWCRRDTVAWLRKHGFPEGPLHMRPDHDRRPARQFKLDVVTMLAETHGAVEMFDDDVKVVALLRENGFTVHHATWMDGGTDGVDAILLEAQEDEGRT